MKTPQILTAVIAIPISETLGLSVKSRPRTK